MIKNIVDKCEKHIENYFGRKHCVLVGRATTAIYLALKSIRSGKVIIPAIACPNPLYAALYANLEIVYCDVNLEDYTIDMGHLEKLLKEHEDIKAILLIHLYGNPCNFQLVESIVGSREILLIEDVAQALGGKYINKKLGSLGDVSILSFSENKILELSGGGALLTDDDSLAAFARKEILKMPEEPVNLEFMQNLYKRFYYLVRDLEKIGINGSEFHSKFPEIFQSMYLFKINLKKSKKILENFDKIEQEKKNRNYKANTYRSLLKSPLIVHSKINGCSSSAYWRYSFLYKGCNLNDFLNKVREKGIDISNWYPSLNELYSSQINEELRNSKYIAERIVNLWTDSSKTINQIEKDCKVILQIIENI